MTKLSELSYDELKKFNQELLEEAKPTLIELIKILTREARSLEIEKLYPRYRGWYRLIENKIRSYLIETDSRYCPNLLQWEMSVTLMLRETETSDLYARQKFVIVTELTALGKVGIRPIMSNDLIAFVRNPDDWLPVLKAWCKETHTEEESSSRRNEELSRRYLLQLMETGVE